MMILLTEQEYNVLKNQDLHLVAKNQIKGRLMKVVKEYERDLQMMPGGREFLLALSAALEKS